VLKGELYKFCALEPKDVMQMGEINIINSKMKSCMELIELFVIRNIRKNFFPLRVTEHWNRLPGESPSLEIFKTRLDKVLCSLL